MNDASRQEVAVPDSIVQHHRISFRLAGASMMGTVLEWYDFMVYNTMAALIFGEVFFPKADPLVGTILAFSTYAVGYISRPLGGFVFGGLGDRRGRRAVLVLTLVLMGAATSLIALLPSYAEIGPWSPLLLVVLRFTQGIALGGEWAGAVLLAVEHGAPGNRGLNASWAQIGPAGGTVLSSAVIGVMTLALSQRQFGEWGWRIPFALSGLLVLFGLWLRLNIDETPVFRALRDRSEQSRTPVREILRDHTVSLLRASAARIGPDVVYALLVVFSVTYTTQVLGLSRQLSLGCLLAGSALNAVAVPFFGLLTDRLGRRPVYLASLGAAALLMLVFFPIVDMRSPLALAAMISVGMLIHAAMYSTQGAFIPEQFPSRLRYTGASVAYTVGSLAGGGAFAPLIMTSLYQQTHETTGVALYVCAALLATGGAVAFSRETRHDK